MRILIALFLAMGTISARGRAAGPEPIQRIPLLTARLTPEKNVERVEIKQITFKPLQKTGLHRHPIPVVGYLIKGTVSFQIDGESPKTLRAGDVFFEPAQVKILRFDNVSPSEPAVFIAQYLMAKTDSELIQMLEP